MATFSSTLSVVINTKNSAQTLGATLRSIADIADEIVVMDMHSTDATVSIAEKHGAKVYHHDDVGYVEPARNTAIAQATKDWIFILDADETVSPELAQKIKHEFIQTPDVDAYFLPRKNIIFGKWVKTGWWPDHILRLFRSGHVVWSDEIHAVPQVEGQVIRLPEKETFAILHENYQTVDQFIDRAQRYAGIAQHTAPTAWSDPAEAFFDELIRRYYDWDGYKDGTHGVMLSWLQAATAIITSAKQWETQGFTQHQTRKTLSQQLARFTRAARYWEFTKKMESSAGIARWWYRLRRRMVL